jgi:hypothetical protein
MIQLVSDMPPVMPAPSQAQWLSSVMATECDSHTQLQKIENKWKGVQLSHTEGTSWQRVYSRSDTVLFEYRRIPIRRKKNRLPHEAPVVV